MGSSSNTIVYKRISCLAPEWLVNSIDAYKGLDGRTRTDVMRRWLERIARHKQKTGEL